MDAKTLLYKCVYVVLMKRWGDDEAHHYVMGVFTEQAEAKRVAEEEREWRGGKYEWVIEAYSLDKSRRDCPMGKTFHRVDRSEEMAVLTDEEHKKLITNLKENQGPPPEWSEHMRKKDLKRLAEQCTQMETMLEELRKENIQLRESLNGRKEV